RQLGISTYAAILILDMCLFRDNFSSGIIDKTLIDAQHKLKKIRFAYDFLGYVPENATQEELAISALGKEIKQLKQIRSNSKTGIDWENGSNVRVGTSLRGGTLQLLHVSELGHVAIHAPQKAKEIVTGSINAVSKNGIVIRESTHEGGRFGINYDMTSKSMEMCGKRLSSLDWRFFFFPWWKSPEYAQDAKGVRIPGYLEKYFTEIKSAGIELTDEQKAWYASQERTMGYAMRQEYPSTPDEAFDKQDENAIYGPWIDQLREKGRLNCRFEVDLIYPLYVSMDLGKGDQTSMWIVQNCKMEHRVIDHFQANRQLIGFYATKLREWEKDYGVIKTVFIPHDGNNGDWNGSSFEQGIMNAGFTVTRLPRIPDVWEGIDQTRDVLRDCVFHERCDEPIEAGGKKYISGLNALKNYRKLPAGANGALREEPLHDVCSDSADAFRYYAEAYKRELVNTVVFTPRKRTTITGLGIARSGGFRRSNDDW
ncbi:MAG: hypothetical protein RSA21_09475, partial [Akkermansia sp.]